MGQVTGLGGRAVTWVLLHEAPLSAFTDIHSLGPTDRNQSLVALSIAAHSGTEASKPNCCREAWLDRNRRPLAG
jgi:hypothetical protein